MYATTTVILSCPPACVGQFNEPLAGNGRILPGKDHGENLFIADHIGQAVGTEDQNVASQQVQFVEVHLHLGFGPDGAGQNVLDFRFLGLFPADEFPLYLFGHDGVVIRELFDVAGANQVQTAVAHMGDAQLAVMQKGANDGRSHALPLGVAPRRFVDGHVCQAHRRAQTVGRFR